MIVCCQEQHKSKRLEDSMKKVDEELKRTDALLYQMIPKQIADKLRQGESVMNISQVTMKATPNTKYQKSDHTLGEPYIQ